MKILSSFTHPQVVSNLYEFLCSAEQKYILKKVCNHGVFDTIDFCSRKKNTMEVNGAQTLNIVKYWLCSSKRGFGIMASFFPDGTLKNSDFGTPELFLILCAICIRCSTSGPWA